jgi:hypothetical protein
MPAPAGKEAGRGQWHRHCLDRGRRQAVIGAPDFRWNVAGRATPYSAISAIWRSWASRSSKVNAIGVMASVPTPASR